MQWHSGDLRSQECTTQPRPAHSRHSLPPTHAQRRRRRCIKPNRMRPGGPHTLAAAATQGFAPAASAFQNGGSTRRSRLRAALRRPVQRPGGRDPAARAVPASVMPAPATVASGGGGGSGGGSRLCAAGHCFQPTSLRSLLPLCRRVRRQHAARRVCHRWRDAVDSPPLLAHVAARLRLLRVISLDGCSNAECDSEVDEQPVDTYSGLKFLHTWLPRHTAHVWSMTEPTTALPP